MAEGAVFIRMIQTDLILNQFFSKSELLIVPNELGLNVITARAGER